MSCSEISVSHSKHRVIHTYSATKSLILSLVVISFHRYFYPFLLLPLFLPLTALSVRPPKGSFTCTVIAALMKKGEGKKAVTRHRVN